MSQASVRISGLLTAGFERFEQIRGLVTHLPRRLEPQTVVRFRAGLEIALTVTLAVVTAQLVWTVTEPASFGRSGEAVALTPGPRAPALDLSAIMTIDPFHRGTAVNAPASRAPETMLNVVLFGIGAGSSTVPGTAIIATPDGRQDVYTVGQEIIPGVRLDRIYADRVTIRRNGVSETLSFDHAQDKPATESVAVATEPTRPTQPPQRRIDVDFAQFVSLVKFSPSASGPGLVLEGSTDESLMAQAGLEPGDVLLSVNGQDVVNAGALMALAASKPARLSLEVERKGQRNFHTLTVDR